MQNREEISAEIATLVKELAIALTEAVSFADVEHPEKMSHLQVQLVLPDEIIALIDKQMPIREDDGSQKDKLLIEKLKSLVTGTLVTNLVRHGVIRVREHKEAQYLMSMVMGEDDHDSAGHC